MFETEPVAWTQRVLLAVQEAHEVAFTIAENSIAQNQVVHRPADIERINLHVAVMVECGGDRRMRGLERVRASEEQARGPRTDNKRRGRGHDRDSGRLK